MTLPSAELLIKPTPQGDRRAEAAELMSRARLLETVLHDFKVKGRIVGVNQGPVVTRFELEPAAGVKASRVKGLSSDLARNMTSNSARVSTIPGKTGLGIELPNEDREAVSFYELITSPAFVNEEMVLPIILGKDISGQPIIADLAAMPHLLIAGTTGSGKSVGLNAMILSLLYRMTPKELRLIMIDPKMLEFGMYDGIPHLLTPVVTESDKAVRALRWAVDEMEARFRRMAAAGVRNLASYNEKQIDDMPHIVVVVDELADLMSSAGKEVEKLIQRIAQKARAAGIHLILATQRPSVDVITGVIKANLPTRISFSVTSSVDSRTILGEEGAEDLLGKGDMLYMSGGKAIQRVHGPFVADAEVQAITDHWRDIAPADYVTGVVEELVVMEVTEGEPEDSQYAEARKIVNRRKAISVFALQDAMGIGFNVASSLLERMCKEGVLGRPDAKGNWTRK